MSSNAQSLASFVWSIAEILRGDFKQSEYGKVILPFVVMRRLDCILEGSKDAVLRAAKALPKGVDDPADIDFTEDMLRLQAFRVDQKEQGSASLSPGDRAALKPISEFGAKPYTEDEERLLSAIIKAFNERHGTQFTRKDFIRFEQVNRTIVDDDMAEMLRNNPPDVVYAAFSQAFFKRAIDLFQRDNEMKNIVLTDAQVREQAIRHFFNRALREVRERHTRI